MDDRHDEPQRPGRAVASSSPSSCPAARPSLRRTARSAVRRSGRLVAAVVLAGAAAVGAAGPSAAAPAGPAVDASRTLGAGGAVGAVPPAGTTGQEGPTAWVRTANLLSGPGAVDVRLAPFSGEGGTGQGPAAGLERRSEQGAVDTYTAVTPEQYAVTLRPAGGSTDDEPLATTSLTLRAGQAYTLVAIAGDDGTPGVQLLEDDLTPPAPGQSDVRLVSAVPQAQVVIDGGAEAVPGAGPDYVPVAAGDRLVEVSDGGSSTSLRLGLVSRSSYTLFVRPGPDGVLGVRAVVDQAAAEQVPVGGIDTGGGWLATRPPRTDHRWSVAAGTAAAVAVLAATVLLARRARDR